MSSYCKINVWGTSEDVKCRECLERQSSRSINIVGKDDISRQGEIPDR